MENIDTIDQLSSRYLSIKEKIKQLETEVELVRTQIENEMEYANKTKMVTATYTIEKRPLSSERMVRANVPEEIWKRYAKPFTVECLYVRKNERKTRGPRRSGGSTRRRRSGERSSAS